MLTGAESKEHEGILMLYRGKQADSYEYAGRVRLLQNGQEAMLGYMLECPNYYEENQKECCSVLQWEFQVRINMIIKMCSP